jgi:hypothetical protein
MIRLRVFNVLKHWVDKSYAYDFADDVVASELLLGAIERLTRVGMDRPAAQLTELVQRKRCVRAQIVCTPMALMLGGRARGRPVARADHEANRPVTPVPDANKGADGGSMDVTALLLARPPLEVAQQLTLRDHELFCGITPPQLMSLVKGASTREQKWARAPHVMAVSDSFNQLSWWATSAVLFAPTPDARRQALTYMVQLARALRDVNNWNGMMAGASCAQPVLLRLKALTVHAGARRARSLVVSGLTLTAVRRLTKLWASVDRTVPATLDELSALIARDGNFGNLRTALGKVAVLPHVKVCRAHTCRLTPPTVGACPRPNRRRCRTWACT